MIVRTGTGLRLSRTYFTKNLVVAAGRRARDPTNLEPSPIGLFHDVQTIFVEIKHRKSGSQGVKERSVSRSPDRLIELDTVELVSLCHPYDYTYSAGPAR
jgi:hypothetical protein